MKKILILFASSHGQTAKIGRALARRLEAAGHDATVHDISAGPPPAPDDYDAILLGSRVELGGFARPIARYVRRHRSSLEARWSGFYAVSMSAASPQERGRAAVQQIIDEFLEKTGWHPTRTGSFAGALAYTQYGPITRFIMKRISAANHGETDTTRDHEYTDWAAVDAFADTLDRDLITCPVPDRTRPQDRNASGPSMGASV
jgi:menaquinone-dependent protoporphyrinogen oxidase